MCFKQQKQSNPVNLAKLRQVVRLLMTLQDCLGKPEMTERYRAILPSPIDHVLPITEKIAH